MDRDNGANVDMSEMVIHKVNNYKLHSPNQFININMANPEETSNIESEYNSVKSNDMVTETETKTIGDETISLEKRIFDNGSVETRETVISKDNQFVTYVYDISHKHIKTQHGLFGNEVSYDDNTLTIAILGDLHGHLKLGYDALFAWKNYTKRDIDCILQVGDIGAFPNPAKLDTSTARFSDHDIEELGFHKFLKDTGDSRNYFGNGGDFEDTDMYFIKGNHEDFDYLDSFNIISPVDFHKRIMYAPNGQVIKLNLKGKSINIGCLGGLDTGNSKLRYDLKDKDISKLTTEPIDILLTHHPAYSVEQPHGSMKIKALIDQIKPKFSVSGHMHNVKKVNYDNTISVNMNEVNYSKGIIKPNSVGILSIN